MPRLRIASPLGALAAMMCSGLAAGSYDGNSECVQDLLNPPMGSCEGSAECMMGADMDESSVLQVRTPLVGAMAAEPSGPPPNWYTAAYHRAGEGAVQPTIDVLKKCSLDDSNCSIGSMAGQPTLVYPGGDTLCISGGPYAFLVIPGDADKLAIYFEGGGACWEADHPDFGKTVVTECSQDLGAALKLSGMGAGILDDTNAKNPFKSWTVIQALYCSGDAFVGNSSMNEPGHTYIQRGYPNALAVKKWAVANFGSRQLANFVVTGFSAGALGTIAWCADLLGAFTYDRASVLFDSYAGVFPENKTSVTLKRWGACDVGLFPSALCEVVNLTMQSVVELALKRYPKVFFGSIQSKVDKTQIWFYNGIAQSWGEGEITPSNFYRTTLAMFTDYHSKVPNFAAYLINSDQHTYIDRDLFYDSSTDGPFPSTRGPCQRRAKKPTLAQWVNMVVNPTSGNCRVASQCTGPTEARSPNSTDYCPAALES